jgi:hypothetical protein
VSAHERVASSGPVFSGNEWLDKFMQAQAALQAQQFFLLFSLGQLGAVARYDRERAAALAVCVKTDIADVEDAAAALARTARNIVANVEHNLAEH